MLLCPAPLARRHRRRWMVGSGRNLPSVVRISSLASAIVGVEAALPTFVPPELALLERCGNESDTCMSQPRIVAHTGRLRAAASNKDVTVVLNHWKRPANNLAKQLRAAAAAETVREVWVCIFGSSFESEYLQVIAEAQGEASSKEASKLRVIRSEIDFGVYGRFLLASSATTRFVYIVDDDVAFPVGITAQYLARFEQDGPAIWGHAGHLLHTDPDKARWVDRPRKPTVVDYANAGWFLETNWIGAAFLREPPPSRLTGEDMHLSHMVRKVLGLETRVVGWRRDGHALSRYRLEMTEMTTLTPSIFAFRSFLSRSQLSRGHVMRKSPPLEAVAYVDTIFQAAAVATELNRCDSSWQLSGGVDRGEGSAQLCEARRLSLERRGAFRLALAISGLQSDEERERIEAIGTDVCVRLSTPSCVYTPYELCGVFCKKMQFAQVVSFNLQVGNRLGGAALPRASRALLAADALEAAAGLLGSLRLSHLVVPAETSVVRRMVLEAVALHVEEGKQLEVIELTPVAS
eukprot:TRINITY_DN43410_c0_g1_i1.p1 TRINITY_DN43410_c0_g1~~TRINITY_DN43410_c0_g1_i1.p1  ORF type:complete len:558 (+),score=70.89 TRINITY_DN43410_c0_g1_i1:117-1676(+)